MTKFAKTDKKKTDSKMNFAFIFLKKKDRVQTDKKKESRVSFFLTRIWLTKNEMESG